MKRQVILCLLIAATARAQDQTARDLTVRLFDTDRVATLTVTPLSPSTTWKRCPTCAAQPLTTPITTSLADHPHLTITGEARLESDAHRRASAAALWHLDTDRDSLRLRVTLPSERYVAAVLTGEAAPDEPAASLRALAIVIRSFALTHSGELTDSTRTQAMRLGPVSAAVNQAVHDTAGETLWFHATQVPAFFTQSSGGATESSAAAWGGPAQPWLPTQPDPASDRTASQWHTEIPIAALRSALAAEGYAVPGPIHTLTITRRTASGRAARLQIGPLDLPAATFRFAVNRSLGWNRLRSDLYTVRLAGPDAIFDGKGYGHGVGLSQSGARTLALDGTTFDAILRLYFPGTVIRITPADTGWHTREANGWSLTAATPAGSIVQAGDTAWQHALTLFPPRSPVHPEVRLYPTTALFRGATSEPGWTLAATRGNEVALQPPGILGQNPGKLLLHEFLHVLIEHETTASVPLWFREGLAEALAEPSHAQPAQAIAATEAQLAHPASLAQAQRAHAEAAALVRRLAAVYSLDTMRTWLRRGLPDDALIRAGLR